ncbi:Galactoside 2-alpha-L-fucosyltransferase [Zea mays]|jgi:xyloglucan fucosyltransferase|uniref:Fucosyltransferase n=1 Tax=Zea mays TaxID=4577 RepID=A0A1D6LVA5_MAIZE|nr:Galactoside 2-alpha-L-fucosyltransferase [Zea mays]
MKGMYRENATANGEVVGGREPAAEPRAHEEYQHYGVKSHEYKAWAEIYLLSLTDMLVTTGKSTFDRLRGPGTRRAEAVGPAQTGQRHSWCSRDMSLEPCFRIAPPYDCKRRHDDSGEIVPHVRHCEDVRAHGAEAC